MNAAPQCLGSKRNAQPWDLGEIEGPDFNSSNCYVGDKIHKSSDSVVAWCQY